jgi:hypothetical protein
VNPKPKNHLQLILVAVCVNCRHKITLYKRPTFFLRILDVPSSHCSLFHLSVVPFEHAKLRSRFERKWVWIDDG